MGTLPIVLSESFTTISQKGIASASKVLVGSTWEDLAGTPGICCGYYQKDIVDIPRDLLQVLLETCCGFLPEWHFGLYIGLVFSKRLANRQKWLADFIIRHSDHRNGSIESTKWLWLTLRLLFSAHIVIT